ncbi:MAG: recombinase family protein [Acidiferrobacterales bacterium]
MTSVPPPGASWNRRTRRCKGWPSNAIYGDLKRGFGILCNPLYAGIYIWNRTRRVVDPDTKARKHFPRPAEEWVVKEMPELRIVEPELWDRVQRRLRRYREKTWSVQQTLHKNARTGRGPKYLFSGLLKCGACGANFIIVNAHSYGCAAHKDRGPHVCANNLKVPRSIVEQRLLESIKRDLFTDQYIGLFKQETARLLAERKRKTTSTQSIRENLAKIDKEIDNLLSALKAGIVTRSTRTELEQLEGERDKLLSQLEVDTRRLDRVSHILPRAVERFKDLVDNLESVTLRDVTRARTQIEHLLGEVTLHPRDGYLDAEFGANYEGLLKLAEISLVPRRGLEPPRGCPH